MKKIILDNSNFTSQINDNAVILVKFSASWCQPCKALDSILDNLSSQFPDIVLGAVDVEESAMLAAKFNIRNVPTLMAWKNGEILWTKIGLPSPGDLAQELKKL